MRTGARVSKEGTDLIGGLRRENVLEFASLLLDFGFAIQRQAVGEEPLGQPMPANDVGGALPASRC